MASTAPRLSRKQVETMSGLLHEHDAREGFKDPSMMEMELEAEAAPPAQPGHVQGTAKAPVTLSFKSGRDDAQRGARWGTL